MGDKINILLIEDNPADAHLFDIYLKEAYSGQYTLLRADRLSVGLKLIAENKFDVIIIDLNLPDSSGIETFKEVHNVAPEIPIIVLTGLEDESVGINTVKLGAQDFLVKGKLGSKGLRRSINYSIERYKLLQSLSENAKKLEEKSADLKREKQKLAQAQKLAQVGSWEWDIKQNIFSCSDELYSILGVSPTEFKITYESFFNFVHPDEKENVKRTITEAIKNKQAFDFFHRIVRNDKEVRSLHSKGEMLLNNDGEILTVIGTEQDVTEKKKEQELEQLAMVATKSYNAVTIADKNGLIEWVNEGFTRLFGYSLDDVKGTHGEILRRGETTGLSPESGFVQGKKPIAYENKNYAKSGKEYWVLTSLTPILNEKGEVEKIISIDSDISKQKSAEQKLIIANKIAEHSLEQGNKALEELHKAKEQLEESLKVKEQFLANMSHEIRTPMNAIIGFTNLLLKNDLAEENKQYVKAIKTSGENLLVIINDILDFSKLEAGKITFENIDFNVFQVVSTVVELMLPKTIEKNIKLSSVIDKKIPEHLKGDPTRLSQILINLVGNAIKFTNEGGVKIIVSLVKDSPLDIELEFSVIDTGIGIPKEAQEKIFESFTQARNDTTRKYGGTGLGLTISKQLVEQQGGMITITSEENKGSTFSFKLTFKKIAVGADLKNVEADNCSGNFPLEGKHILLVEDNFLNQVLATKILENWKCFVDVAANGLIATEKVEKNDYDIVLMDIQLPEMNGYEATTYIRQKLPSPKNSVPIIAMTAHALADEAEKCLKLGMNDYISKPFNEDQLHTKICKALQKKENLVTSKEKIPLPFGNGQQKKLTDMSYLEKIANGDKNFILKMVTVFLEQTPGMLESMRYDVSVKDWKALKAIAHKMKPSVAFMGMKELEELVINIEDLAAKEESLDKIPDLLQKATEISEKAFKELEEEKKKLQEVTV